MLTINSFPGRIPLLENALQVGCCTIKSMTTEELYLYSLPCTKPPIFQYISPYYFSLLKLPQSFVHSKMQKNPEEAVPVERGSTCNIPRTTRQNV